MRLSYQGLKRLSTNPEPSGRACRLLNKGCQFNHSFPPLVWLRCVCSLLLCVLYYVHKLFCHKMQRSSFLLLTLLFCLCCLSQLKEVMSKCGLPKADGYIVMCSFTHIFIGNPARCQALCQAWGR